MINLLFALVLVVTIHALLSKMSNLMGQKSIPVSVYSNIQMGAINVQQLSFPANAVASKWPSTSQ